MLPYLGQLYKTRVIIRAQCFNQIRKSRGNAASRFLVQEIKGNNEDRMLHVTWNSGSLNRYPYVFLRDNCRCPECFHDSSCQRRFDTVGSLDMNILPEKLELTEHGKELTVTWPDGHISVFDSKWLHSRRLSEDEGSGKKPTSLNKKGVELWDAKKLQGNIPRFDFREVMADDLTLFNWLSSVHRLGIALVCNTPLKLGQADKFCERVGHHKPTHYGHNFQVKAKHGANNLAYTSDTLPLHSDLAYLDYAPGVQLLQCIEQIPGIGGANQFADGFYVSKLLRDLDPKRFDLLSSSPLNFFDVGEDTFGDYDMKVAHTTIELDNNGQLSRFFLSNGARDCLTRKESPECVVELYEAYLTIGKMMRDPANVIEYKMIPSDMVTVNNHRVTHGRTGFTVTEGGSRFLVGIYMDWDTMYSRLRVLARKLNLPCPC